METKEETVFLGHPVMASRLGQVFLLLILAAGGVYGGAKASPWLYLVTAFAVLALVYMWLILKSFVYKVTNQRVLMEEGIFGRKTMEVDIRDIRSMEVDRGVLGMMFNFGDLLISTAGDTHRIEGGLEITFASVHGPMVLKEKIHALKVAAESSSD